MLKQKNVEKKEKEEIKTIEKAVLSLLFEAAKNKEGALVVIGDLPEEKYSQLFPNIFEGKKYNILDASIQPILQRLISLDGAVIIKPDGEIKTIGAKINAYDRFPGHGMRHATARGISKEGYVAMLASEEDGLVRIFKEGNLLAEINPRTKTAKKSLDFIVEVLNRPETAIIASASIAAPMLSIPILPGVVVFAGSYLVAKNVLKFLKREMRE